MLAKVLSGAVVGLEGVLVNVEVDITKKGFGAFKIVGLPSKAVDEARDRVKTAIDNSEIEFTKYRLTVNLAPADLPKEGPTYDLPIAVGVMIAMEKIKLQAVGTDSIFFGELSLDGSLSSTPAILPLTMLAREQGLKKVFVPAINAAEAAIVKDVDIYPVNNLKELVLHLNQIQTIQPVRGNQIDYSDVEETFDFGLEDVKGQEYAKRALIVAAAGGHNLLFSGPPGAGKTMLARVLPAILPRLTWEESLDVTKIHSIIHSVNPKQPLIHRRPFRSPHHTTSRIGLIGGGSNLTPGEISLAHRGVLFLDEIPEFPRSVLESLRQPMEDGFVTISRARGTAQFPSSFMLVSSANPCPCGWFGSTERRCNCSPNKLSAYQRRLSGPLLDRIDIHTTVREVNPGDLIGRSDLTELKELDNHKNKSDRGAVEEKNNNNRTESQRQDQTNKPEYPETLKAKDQIKSARAIQLSRFKNLIITTNAEMNSKQIQKFCDLTPELNTLLIMASNRFGLSARSIHKTLKVSRTIADLDQSEQIKEQHLTEALNYRKKETAI